MASPKSQIIENAQRYAANGKINEAIAEWERLLSDASQAQDGNVYNTIADLYLRKNDKENAVNTCLKAAQVYKDAGFELKGVAVLKKIFKVDPDRVDIHERLADINVERGLTGSAIEGYQKTVKLYMQQGNFKAAIGVYRKLARFSPDDPEIPLAIARLHQKQEQNREAILAYEQAEAIYESKNMSADASRIVEEIVKLNPNYIKHLTKKEASVAELDTIVSPKDAVLSAVSSHEAQRFVPPIPVYSEMGSLDTESAAREYDSTPSPAEEGYYPSTPSFQEQGGQGDIVEGRALAEANFQKGAFWSPPEAPLPDPPAHENLFNEEPPMLSSQLKSPVQARPRQHAPGQQTPDVSEVIFRAHLAEVDVYLRYGLHQNAVEKLLLAKELDPTREEPYLRLREIYTKGGENEKAAHESLALIKLYEQQNRNDKKEALLSEMRASNPYAKEVEQEARGIPDLAPPMPPPMLSPVRAVHPVPTPSYDWSAPSLHQNPAAPIRPMPGNTPPPAPPLSPPPGIPREAVLRGRLSSGGYPSADPPKGEEEYFDLTSAMANEFGDPAQGLLIPAQKGAGKRDLSGGGEGGYEDKRQQYVESCYHLGIAHKEMGNYEKAVRELEQALTGSRGKRFQEVLILLASCYAESGYVAQAIEILQGGVNDPRCDPDSRLFAQYALASYFEQLGDKERSFGLYKEIYRVDPNFKDVSGKVKEIPYRKAQEVIRLRERQEMQENMDLPVFEPEFRKVEPAKDKRRISYV